MTNFLKDDPLIRNIIAISITAAFIFSVGLLGWASYTHANVSYFTGITSVFGAIMGAIIGFYFGSQGLQDAIKKQRDNEILYANTKNSLSIAKDIIKGLDVEVYSEIEEDFERDLQEQ